MSTKKWGEKKKKKEKKQQEASRDLGRAHKFCTCFILAIVS